MVKLESAYNFIAKDWKETLVFCVLAAITIFIPVFGQLLIAGLLIRIISDAINKKNKIPDVFGNISEDLLNGLKYTLFGIIISLPIIILFFAGVIGMGISTVFNNYDYSSMPTMNFGGSIVIFMVALFILAIIYAILVPALACNYAKKKKFNAFFDIKKVWNIVFGHFGEYIKMVGIQIVYSLAIGIIASALGFTFIIPLLCSTLMLLVSFRIQGEWFSEVSK
jgi:hypothetical protein